MTDQKKIKGEVNIWKADMKGSLDSVITLSITKGIWVRQVIGQKNLIADYMNKVCIKKCLMLK